MGKALKDAVLIQAWLKRRTRLIRSDPSANLLQPPSVRLGRAWPVWDVGREDSTAAATYCARSLSFSVSLALENKANDLWLLVHESKLQSYLHKQDMSTWLFFYSQKNSQRVDVHRHGSLVRTDIRNEWVVMNEPVYVECCGFISDIHTIPTSIQ